MKNFLKILKNKGMHNWGYEIVAQVKCNTVIQCSTQIKC